MSKQATESILAGKQITHRRAMLIVRSAEKTQSLNPEHLRLHPTRTDPGQKLRSN